MPTRYVFADEAGNFDFSPGGSRYFILTSVTLDDCRIGDDLIRLRRGICHRDVELLNGFHATEDLQAVRNEVFALRSGHEFRIDATIVEKAKTVPHLREEELRFYKRVWRFHMSRLAPIIANPGDDLFVIEATLTIRKKKQRVDEAIAEVLGTTARSTPFRTASWSAASEPCLQVADDCCWAIQRKWERNDERSYVLIADKIRSGFDVFRWGPRTYY